MQTKLQEMIEDEEPVKEIIGTIKEEMKKHSVPEHEVIVMVSGGAGGEGLSLAGGRVGRPASIMRF